jgi:hypothetical protein
MRSLPTQIGATNIGLRFVAAVILLLCSPTESQASDNAGFPPQYKLLLSPGVQNELPNGQPMITYDSHPPSNPNDVITCSANGRCTGDGVTAQQPLPSPCLTTIITLCDQPITIAATALTGQTLQLTMPAPFVPDPFSVQCVLGGNPPVPRFEVLDSSAVTCATVPPPSD